MPTVQQTERIQLSNYRVQKNVTAWLVLGLRPFDQTTPALRQLHWLSVVYRVQYKLSVLKHEIANKEAPIYLQEHVHCVSKKRDPDVIDCNFEKY